MRFARHLQKKNTLLCPLKCSTNSLLFGGGDAVFFFPFSPFLFYLFKRAIIVVRYTSAKFQVSTLNLSIFSLQTEKAGSASRVFWHSIIGVELEVGRNQPPF